MAGAAGLRPQALAGANLAVLAAGTAATIYLWLRVFGLDLGPISFPGDSASPAFERSTVAATIDLTPASESRPQPESMVRGGGSQLAFAPPTPAASDSDRDRPKTRSKQRTRRNGWTGGTAEPAAAPASTARGADTRALGAGPHRPRALVAACRPDSRQAPRRRRRRESRATDAAHRRRHPRLAWPFRSPDADPAPSCRQRGRCVG
jgi:hypothetical protein